MHALIFIGKVWRKDFTIVPGGVIAPETLYSPLPISQRPVPCGHLAAEGTSLIELHQLWMSPTLDLDSP